MNIKLLVLSLATILTGCVNTNGPATYRYSLISTPAEPLIAKTHKKTNLVIKISPIQTKQSLMSSHIVYVNTSKNGQNNYAHNRWSDTPSKLLEALWIEEIENNSYFKAVVPSHFISKADYVLESNLYDFTQYLYDDGSSNGVIKLRLYLIDNKTKEIISSQEMLSITPIEEQNAAGTVAALNTAAIQINKKLITWLESNKSLLRE